MSGAIVTTAIASQFWRSATCSYRVEGARISRLQYVP